MSQSRPRNLRLSSACFPMAILAAPRRNRHVARSRSMQLGRHADRDADRTAAPGVKHRTSRHAVQAHPTRQSRRMFGNDAQKLGCAKVARRNHHFMDQLHLDSQTVCRRNVVRHEDPARSPRCWCRSGPRNPEDRAEWFPEDHAARRGSCRCRCRSDAWSASGALPAMTWPSRCTQTQRLAGVSYWSNSIPLASGRSHWLLDERPVPCPEHVREQLSVVVQVVIRQRRGFHSPVSFFRFFKPLKGQSSNHSSRYSRAFRIASEAVRASSRIRADWTRALKALSEMPSFSAAAACRSPFARHCNASICAFVRFRGRLCLNVQLRRHCPSRRPISASVNSRSERLMPTMDREVIGP